MDTTAREKRLEQTLQQAARLLEDGKATEAKLRFDEALGLDPKNTRALEGRRLAEERILATKTREHLGRGSGRAGALPGRRVREGARPLDRRRRGQEERRRPRPARPGPPDRGRHPAGEGPAARIQALLRRARSCLPRASTRRPRSPSRVCWCSNQATRGRGNAWSRPSARRAMPSSRAGCPTRAPARDLARSRARSAGADRAGPNVGVVGVAIDDRGMGRVEMRVGRSPGCGGEGRPDLATAGRAAHASRSAGASSWRPARTRSRSSPSTTRGRSGAKACS